VTYRPHPVRPSRNPAKGRYCRQGLAPYVLAGICLALVAALPALSDPSIRTKQAEAAAALAKLNGLQAALEPAIQRYDLAKLRLARVQQNLRENRMEGNVARHNLQVSQRAMAARPDSFDTLRAVTDRIAVLVNKKLVIGTIAELQQNDDPWIKEYFSGVRNWRP